MLILQNGLLPKTRAIFLRSLVNNSKDMPMFRRSFPLQKKRRDSLEKGKPAPIAPMVSKKMKLSPRNLKSQKMLLTKTNKIMSNGMILGSILIWRQAALTKKEAR